MLLRQTVFPKAIQPLGICVLLSISTCVIQPCPLYCSSPCLILSAFHVGYLTQLTHHDRPAHAAKVQPGPKAEVEGHSAANTLHRSMAPHLARSFLRPVPSFLAVVSPKDRQRIPAYLTHSNDEVEARHGASRSNSNFFGPASNPHCPTPPIFIQARPGAE